MQIGELVALVRAERAQVEGATSGAFDAVLSQKLDLLLKIEELLIDYERLARG
ncbi:MAG: hypothetical protein ACRDGM_03655 [bacterium]